MKQCFVCKKEIKYLKKNINSLYCIDCLIDYLFRMFDHDLIIINGPKFIRYRFNLSKKDIEKRLIAYVL